MSGISHYTDFLKNRKCNAKLYIVIYPTGISNKAKNKLFWRATPCRLLKKPA
jgi:hypothetical protein